MNKLFIVIGILVLIMIKLCSKSHFKNNFSAETYSPDDTKPENINSDSTLIFHATWCGHCKKSMNEFKKAVAQGKGKIMLIDSDEYPELVKKYNVRGFPTIMKANGETYTGPRTASDILAFANE